MTEEELMKTAQSMFLQDIGRRKVIEFFIENDIPSDKANTMATKAYQAIRSQRLETQDRYESAKEGGGSSSVALGVVILAVGIILTFATDRIWYGAMFVGVITMISGMSKSS